MASIYSNLRNERQYLAATGLTKEEFDKLHLVFKDYYEPKSYNHITKREAVLSDPREALFFILYYYKTYPTLEIPGLNFDFSNKTACQYLDYIRPYLKAALAQQDTLVKHLFKDQQAFDATFQDVAEIFIDGTEFPIQRAKDEQLQQKDFSGKKKPTP